MASFLLDQNIPLPVLGWLQSRLDDCLVAHCSELGLGRADDAEVFSKAQEHNSIIITYDEDFADQRVYPVGNHTGVIRLRVEPTTDEITIAALDRLFAVYRPEELVGKLVIVEAHRIRVIGA